MKYIIAVSMLLLACNVYGQSAYKDYYVCTDSITYKGKKNHGKYHCVRYMAIREYKDGIKDTLSRIYMGGQFFIGDEYEDYQRLSERGKYIADSLREDGIPHLQQSYLTYEPMYMKEGEKIEKLWDTQGSDVVIYRYKFWRNKKGQGIEMVSQTKCQ